MANLSDSWEQAEQLVISSRARAWLMYLAISSLAFDHCNLIVHQVKAVRQGNWAPATSPEPAPPGELTTSAPTEGPLACDVNGNARAMS